MYVVCVCGCVCVCVCVCLVVCVIFYMHIFMHVCAYVCFHVCVHVYVSLSVTTVYVYGRVSFKSSLALVRCSGVGYGLPSNWQDWFPCVGVCASVCLSVCWISVTGMVPVCDGRLVTLSYYLYTHTHRAQIFTRVTEGAKTPACWR
jgi:hypothetical protein